MSESSSENVDQMPLTAVPKCKSTQQDLKESDSSLRGVNPCPVCLLFKVTCPIGCHPSSTEVMAALIQQESILGKRKQSIIDLTTTSSSSEEQDSVFDKPSAPSSSS